MVISIPYLIKFSTVLVAMIVADVCWAQYFIKVSERKALAAGSYGSVIVFLGAVSTVNYVHDGTLLIAAVLGAFIGSYGTVYYNNKKSNNSK